MNNEEKDVELIFASKVDNIEEILEQVRKDNHIPIIWIADKNFDFDNEDRAFIGFDYIELEELFNAQIEYENYEGAAFLKLILDERNTEDSNNTP